MSRKPLGGTPRTFMGPDGEPHPLPAYHDKGLMLAAMARVCPHVFGSIPRTEFAAAVDKHSPDDHPAFRAVLAPWAGRWNLHGTWIVDAVIEFLLDPVGAQGLDRLGELPELFAGVGGGPANGGPWALVVQTQHWNMMHDFAVYEAHVLAQVRAQLEAYRLARMRAAADKGYRFVRVNKTEAEPKHYEWLALRLCGTHDVRLKVPRVGVPVGVIASRYRVKDEKYILTTTKKLATRLDLRIPDGRAQPRKRMR
jgi:hypothetical protein